ncbi:MAG: amino acid adenylation domain-containing protein [bacterium]|nr:amino acid adenylation domain-containing protein [bacterium]
MKKTRDDRLLAANQNIKERDYWFKKLEGDLGNSSFPAVLLRATSPGDAGELVSIPLPLDADTRHLVTTVSKNSEELLFMILLAVLTVQLNKYASTNDVIIGAPVYRRETGGERLNTFLALRNRLRPGMTFKELLKQVRKTVIEADENQNYPLEILQEQLTGSSNHMENVPLFATALLVEELHETDFLQDIDYLETVFSFKGKGEELQGCISYAPCLFERQLMEQVAGQFSRLAGRMVADLDTILDNVDMLSPPEREQLLYGFNHRESDSPREHTLVELFRGQACKSPLHPVVKVFDNNAHAGAVFTYGEMNALSDRLALRLLEQGAEAGECIGLCVESSGEMIIGILGILKAGCAYVPLNPKAPAARNAYMLNECGTGLLLNQQRFPIPPGFSGRTLILGEITANNPDKSLPGQYRQSQTLPPSLAESAPSPDSYAYVIFTSGSTGKPKGVPITHRNLSPLLYWGAQTPGIGSKDRVLCNVSYYFDWSVWEIFITLTTGAGLYIVPDDLRLDPPRCIGFMNREEITILHTTPSQFGHFIGTQSEGTGNRQKANTANRAGREKTPGPGTLKYLFIGGENLTHHLLERSLTSIPADCRVFNMYGPTETTIITTVFEIERKELHTFTQLSALPIGVPVGNTLLLILDKNGSPCPLFATGELVIAGDGLAAGYLNNPALTAEKFTRLYREKTLPLTDMFYLTGDLARRLPDGNIQFMGRRDFQVKIRGLRIELGEIENALSKHPAIAQTVVLTRKTKNEDVLLCAYFVPHSREETDAAELKKFLAGILPDYMIPSYFMELEKLPLNPNGKIDRNALPKPQTHTTGPHTPPQTKMEKALADIWSEILKVEKEKIGRESGFFQLGGQSLKAAAVIATIHKTLEVSVTLEDVFTRTTLQAMARHIADTAATTFQAIAPSEEREYYPLSSAQKRLYLLHRMEPGNIRYNMPMAIPLGTGVDKKKIEDTFRRLIARHESFRTSFHMIKNEPVQVIHREVPFCIRHITDESNHVESFDLSRAPLFRVLIAEMGTGKSVLLYDMHHIISDGASQEVLSREFSTLFAGGRLEPLTLQYRDFALWQAAARQQQAIAQQEAFWLDTFREETPVLNLPLDFKRPVIQSFEGATLRFGIDEKTAADFRNLYKSYGATLFMAVLSVFSILLSRLSGQEDVVVGTPSAGRRHADLQHIIGMFVNTLPMRNHPIGTKHYNGFLEEVKKRSLAAFENQDYPFEDLVDKITTRRDTGRNPIFDVMFNMNGGTSEAPDETPNSASAGRDESENRLPAEAHRETVSTFDPGEMVHVPDSVTKFDMTLFCIRMGNQMLFTLEYCKRLFKPGTMESFARYFRKVLKDISARPDIPIAEIDILSQQEKEALVFGFNRREKDFPHQQTLHDLFRGQVQKCPLQRAVTVHDKKGEYITALSYAQLDEMSDDTARLLQAEGVKDNVFIGLCVERSPEMIIGMLGILKAGCAYVPLNPKAPAARNGYMLKECAADFLLTVSNLTLPAGFEGRVFYLDTRHAGRVARHAGRVARHADKDIPLGAGSENRTTSPPPGDRISCPDNYAYAIFTSGSTGEPKGVPITHRNVIPLLHWDYQWLGIGQNDRVLHNLSYYFDWSVMELFISLTSGADLHIIPNDLLLNPGACIDFMNREEITVLHITPTQCAYLIGSAANNSLGQEGAPGPHTLKYLILAGEKVTYDLVERSFDLLCPQCRVFNMYGPTETTVISSGLEVRRENLGRYWELSGIPIGTPAGNTELLVLDKTLNPCPFMVSGELYIGGMGVARGYLNQPELTAEKFIPITFETADKEHPNEVSLENKARETNIFYKTGDLTRRLPDGNIEFLGRLDHQVKIRGFRIELGEIENHLLKHPDIKESVVLAIEKENGEYLLCAYVVPQSLPGPSHGLEDPSHGLDPSHGPGPSHGLDPSHGPGPSHGLEALQAEVLREYLAEKLPDYMIPAFFIELERLPLNPNGKTDRSALPEPGSPADTPNIPPATPMEETLAALWSEVLGIESDSISCDADFFQLGGHSLKATVLISRLQEEFDHELPVVELFQHSTIQRLSKRLAGLDTAVTEKIKCNRDEKLVLLKQGKNDKHFFFIHDGTGDVEGYIELCRFLKDDFNFRGIKARKMDNYTPRNITLEQIADDYIEAVKTIQPNGPYYIAGWSLGGMAAFQMTRQLEQRGETIAFLGIMDSHAPDKKLTKHSTSFDLKGEIKWLRKHFKSPQLKKQLSGIERMEDLWPSVLAYFRERNIDINVIRSLIPPHIAKIVPYFNNLPIEKIIDYLNTSRMLTNAMLGYYPSGGITTPIHFFRAEKTEQLNENTWQDWSSGEVASFQVKGDHYSIFKKPDVKNFARLFNRLLEAVDD